MSKVRRNSNLIDDISINGILCYGSLQVRNGVFSFFKDHFKNAGWNIPRMSDITLPQILAIQRDEPEIPFFKDEVWSALYGCDGNKAPGPDGINLNFVKTNWSIIKYDFMNFMQDFYNDGSVVKDLNKTFIALIPKILSPDSIKDFRPILLRTSDLLV
ncbi:hypothetical protein Ddye_029385 [Dipteronia dyeriana]|uniref:Reverse transcriptase domain-containing protein n=1 Tax=Dipteronia dyeriana TaxID=168575 RepID=A0AAD9WLS0_9ROSI|nr:hypothetical protein Ddye_029385 [Dipteronia dyeriana]